MGKIIAGVAVLTALCSSAAIASLFLSDATTLSFLEYPFDDDAYVVIPPFTSTDIIASSFAGALTLPDYYLLISHFLKGGYAPFKNHHSIEEQDLIKKIGFYTLAGPTIAVLMTQMLYAYATNAVGTEGGVYALGNRGLQIAVSIPFFALQLLKDYRSFSVNYRLMYEALSSKAANIMDRNPKGTEEKKTIRERFAFGMRKLLKDSGKTTELHDSLGGIQGTVKTKRHHLTEQLAILKAKQGTENSRIHQQEIEALENQLQDLEAREALALIKHLYMFDQEGEYKPGNAHPWWYYAARGVGITGIGGLSSVAVWYGMTFVANELGANDSLSYGAGTMASLVAIPYLMDRGRLWLEGTTSLFTHYNPIENESKISSSIVDFSLLNKIISPLNMIKSTYLMIPAAMVGGAGMGLGIGSAAPPMLWRTQLKFIIPSMIGWGAAENKNTGPRLLGSIARSAQYFGFHDEKMTQRQEVADWFHRADRWVEKLAGHHVPELKELLDKYHEDIETGKHGLLGDHKDDSQGSTDSPSSDEKRNSSDDSGGSHKGGTSGEEMKTGDLDAVRTSLFKGEHHDAAAPLTGSATITTTNPLHKDAGLHTTTDSDDDA